jgi:hypothetical protein
MDRRPANLICSERPKNLAGVAARGGWLVTQTQEVFGGSHSQTIQQLFLVGAAGRPRVERPIQ